MTIMLRYLEKVRKRVKCIRLIRTVYNNLGLTASPKALDPNIADNQPFDCTTFDWYLVAPVWSQGIPPTHTINVTHLK